MARFFFFSIANFLVFFHFSCSQNPSILTHLNPVAQARADRKCNETGLYYRISGMMMSRSAQDSIWYYAKTFVNSERECAIMCYQAFTFCFSAKYEPSQHNLGGTCYFSYWKKDCKRLYFMEKLDVPIDVLEPRLIHCVMCDWEMEDLRPIQPPFKQLDTLANQDPKQGCKQPIKFKARPVFGWEKWLKVYQKVQTNSPQNCADFCYSDGSCQAAIYFRGDCHLSYRTIGCDTSSTKGLETIYESGRSVLLYCIVCMNDLPA